MGEKWNYCKNIWGTMLEPANYKIYDVNYLSGSDATAVHNTVKTLQLVDKGIIKEEEAEPIIKTYAKNSRSWSSLEDAQAWQKLEIEAIRVKAIEEDKGIFDKPEGFSYTEGVKEASAGIKDKIPGFEIGGLKRSLQITAVVAMLFIAGIVFIIFVKGRGMEGVEVSAVGK